MSKRLLILDDEPAIGATIAFIAEDAGFEARATTSPTEFFETFAAWAPTHIAIDLIMPEMDGVEVLNRLAQQSCAARIIITSGVGSRVLDAARRTAAENGLDIAGALSKPFTPAALTDLLSEAAPAHAASAQRPAARAEAEPTELELHRGISSGELVLAFQPKVHCDDGRLAGFEALVRWNRGGRLVFPDRFIPLAERTGLIHELTEVVVRDAVQWIAREFPDSDLAMSVNVSAKSLGSQDLGDRIHDHCHQASLSTSRVILEITESSAMEDPLASLALLTRLRVRGFHLSIDDFGTGFSSMGYLKRFPIGMLKIDQSFVRGLPGRADDAAIVTAVLSLAHALHLEVVAEGVETPEQRAFLVSAGCDKLQGFLYSCAVPEDAMLALLRAAPLSSAATAQRPAWPTLAPSAPI